MATSKAQAEAEFADGEALPVQALAEALKSYLLGLGGEVIVNRQITSLEQLPRSRAILCDITPRQLLALAGARLPGGYSRKLQRYRFGPAAFKVDWALAAPVPWRASECARAGTVHLGSSLEEIAAIKEGVSGWDWNDEDRAVLTGVDELIETNDLSDQTWGALSKFYDKRQMMDFVHTVGHYVMIAWSISAMRMPIESYADQIGWDLKTASGKVPTATMKPGESDDWAEKRGYDN